METKKKIKKLKLDKTFTNKLESFFSRKIPNNNEMNK